MILVFWLMKVENRGIATDNWGVTLSWTFSRGNFYDWERSTYDTTDHCWISKRQKHWHLHMTDLFTRCRDIASWPWTKHSHLGKWSNFTSALSNVNNVKISDLLEFLVMLLFFSLCSHPNIICRKLQDYEKIHGGDSFMIT